LKKQQQIYKSACK